MSARICSKIALFCIVTGALSAPASAADTKAVHVAKPAFGKPKLIENAPKVPIRMWTSRDSGKKQEHVLENVDIGGLYFDGLLAYDIQYEKTLQFRGLKLRDLISQYSPIPTDTDFILLHSKQGMIIPVAIRDLRQDTEVFIALAIYDEKQKTWSTNFPSSVYSQPGQTEQVSLAFTNNKMVVGQNWRHTDFAITPWRFFDTLSGIEFISSHDYYKALEPENKNAEVAGRSVYMRRCQYCHGLNDFGAKYGPNFATLFPDDKKQAVDMIMKKVLPPETNKNKQSAKAPTPPAGRMPKQSDFTAADAKDLTSWIKAWKKR